MSLLSKKRWIAPVLCLLAFLGGCASPASREGMTPTAFQVQKALGQSIKVQTSGGSGTGSFDSSNISDEDLKAAIESAITQSGLFQQVIQQGGSEYELSVRITSLRKPLAGFSMTAEMETAWSLVRSSDQKTVLQKAVMTNFTAGVSDAFAGVTRLRMAVEGATRENIAQGIRALSAVQ